MSGNQDMNFEDGFLGMFGLSISDLKKEKTKPQEKKGNTHEKKKSMRKSTGKNYSLPIKICAGHLSMEIPKNEENETLSESEVKKQIKTRFMELSGIYFNLVEFSPENGNDEDTTYFKLDIKYQEVIKENIKFPVKVIAGEYTMDISSEVPFQQIEDDWVALHHEYRGCFFHYVEKQSLLVPFMMPNTVAGKRYLCPIQVGFMGYNMTLTQEELEMDEEGTADLYDIQKKLSENMPEFQNCEFYYSEEDNFLYPIVSFQKKDIKEVQLPISVRIPGMSYDFDNTDFNKSTVTLEELRKKLEEFEPAYSKSRTEMQYDDRGFVVAILIGSRKGVTMTSRRKNQGTYFVQDRRGQMCRVTQMPYGFYSLCNNDVDFYFSAPRVPNRIFNQILAIFREAPAKEIALQIFFNPKEESYQLYQPRQNGTQCAVTFTRNYEMECEQVLMMDIHSHGKTSAFFSSVDNADEKGTQLYMVVGNIARGETFALRAGIAGYYAMLRVQEIFNIEEEEFYGRII